MNVFLFILIGLCLAGMRSAPEGKFYSEYVAPEQADIMSIMYHINIFYLRLSLQSLWL